MIRYETIKKGMTVFAYGVILIFVIISLFAPLIAGNKPYLYVSENGHYYFPILKDYPQFRDVDFRKVEVKGFKVFPPIRYNSTEYDLDSIVLPPSAKHIFGTDEQGRDIAARMIHGSKNSFFISLIAVAIFISIGICLGSLAGYFGGITDIIISRLIETMICVPTLFLILALVAILGPNLFIIMGIIGFTGWTGTARLVRGEFLKFKNAGFVTAARSFGAGNIRIIFRHIFPNALPPVLVTATFGLASTILIESSLSFLGFGIQPPEPSWGDILSQSRDFFDIAWWLAIIPGGTIFAVIASYHVIGRSLQSRFESSRR